MVNKTKPEISSTTNNDETKTTTTTTLAGETTTTTVLRLKPPSPSDKPVKTRNKKQKQGENSITSIRNFFEKQAAKTAINEHAVGGPVHPHDERDQAEQGDGEDDRAQQVPQNILFPLSLHTRVAGPANPSRTVQRQAHNIKSCTPSTRPRPNPSTTQNSGQPVHSKKK